MLTLGELVVSEGTEIKEKDKKEGAGEGYCGYFGPGTELFTFTPPPEVTMFAPQPTASSSDTDISPGCRVFASSAADFREEIKLSYKTTAITDKGGPHDCPAVAESGKSNQVPCFLYKCITEVHV